MIDIESQKQLKDLLNYDSETGLFTWKVYRGGAAPRVGEIAGTRGPEGYIVIKFQGKLKQASHLAWLYMTGSWPADQVDHKNVNPSDNSWENLREASGEQNAHNKRKYKCNTSGYKGVYAAPGGGWHARIRDKGKLKLLGRFDTPEAAHEVYCLAADMLHGEFANHG